MTVISVIPHLQKSFLPLSFGLLNTPLTGGAFTASTLLWDVVSPSSIFTYRHEEMPLCQHFCVDGFIHIPLNSNQTKTYPPILLNEMYLFPHISQNKRKGWHSPITASNLGFSTMSNIFIRSLILHQDLSYLAWPLPSPQSCCLFSFPSFTKTSASGDSFPLLTFPVKDLVSNIFSYRNFYLVSPLFQVE